MGKQGYELEGFQEYFTKLAITKGHIGSSEVQNDTFEADILDVRESNMSVAIPEITTKVTNKDFISNNEIKKGLDDVVDNVLFTQIKELYLKLSVHSYLTTRNEAAIKSLIATEIDGETVLMLMNECYKTASKLKKNPVLKTFSYFRNYIEGTMKEQKVVKETRETGYAKVVFVGDTTADF